ncbi:MAG: AAA family ATPase [Candidatus Paceibacterota bacterium]
MRDVNKIIKYYRPALALDRILPNTIRSRTVTFLPALVLIALIIFGVDGFSNERLFGLFLLLLGIWILFLMLQWFHNSFRLEGTETRVRKHGGSEHAHAVSYEVADILYRSDGNLLQGFIASSVGIEVLLRVGVDPEKIRDLENIGGVDPQSLPDGHISLGDVVSTLFEHNQVFKEFVFSAGVQTEDVIATGEWVESMYRDRKERMRWWGRMRLGRIPAIGTDWSYGTAYTLEKYGNYVDEMGYFSLGSPNEEEIEEEVSAIESVLARGGEANVLLVGEGKDILMEIIGRTAYHVTYGTIFPELQHKRMFLFDGRAFVADLETKAAIERGLIIAFNEAVKAGNLIIVIDDLPGLIDSAKAVDVDVLGILDPYLTASDIQVIGLAQASSFYGSFEHDASVVERFEIVTRSQKEGEDLVRELERIVPRYEATTGLFFTYQAIKSIAENARRYFTTGILADKVHDLMEELAPFVISSGDAVVTEEHVESLVHRKTGIPTGDAGEEERELLLNLEDRLHERIIGQDAAIEGIARALRRSRSGVRNADRPMGSFLFLGPTGVGKTETAKTLARVFFGGTDKMMRFDMSEYKGSDALSKLIGSFEDGKPGRLVQRLREDPYGVVLLDEFEKTSDDVKDLFLQILDEGVFSDMAGREVFARDIIFIATSNAASDTIFKYFNEGKDPVEHTDELINSIVEEGIFKPELLNRFDDVVVFHPLEHEHLVDIARIMLNQLKERLYEQGIDLKITDEIINYVAEEGYNPQFGARPMNRVIQDKIEQAIATKKLEGEVSKGSRIILTREDVEKV